MSTVTDHHYSNTFKVYDEADGNRIGGISLMSDGWAAYDMKNVQRLGTHRTAEDAIAQVYSNYQAILKGTK